MARPNKEGLDYFPHDTDAVNDPKIQALMALHGPTGYAFYFIILERVFRTENGRITIGKLAEKAGLAKTIGINIKTFDEILETALEVECFVLEENHLTSSGIKKRFSSVNEIREKERKRKEEYKNKIKDKEKVKVKEKTGRGKPAENPRKTSDEVFILPEWIDKEAWASFEEMRNKIKKPMTDKAKKLVTSELEKLKASGNDPVAVLNQSTRNSWQDVYALKDKGGKSNGSTGTSTQGNRLAPEAGKYAGVGDVCGEE